jgi:hypothetical protein
MSYFTKRLPEVTDGIINTGWSTPAGTWGDDGSPDIMEYNLDTSVNMPQLI